MKYDLCDVNMCLNKSCVETIADLVGWLSFSSSQGCILKD